MRRVCRRSAEREQTRITPVRAWLERYDNVPASLADACLIRLAELHDPSRILTLDGDFRIDRRHGRKTIALIAPG